MSGRTAGSRYGAGGVSAVQLTDLIAASDTVRAAIQGLTMQVIFQQVNAVTDQLQISTSLITHLIVDEPVGLGASLMAATPIIAPGTIDGQLLRILRTAGANSIIIRDTSTFAAGNVRTATAANITLSGRDGAWFAWRASEGVWIQTTAQVNTA